MLVCLSVCGPEDDLMGKVEPCVSELQGVTVLWQQGRTYFDMLTFSWILITKD